MVTFNTTSEKEKIDQPNWALSMAAAIPSGVLKIFEGTATFGAALLDLGVDRDRVEAVESYFEKINPFDELAASTGIGKLTELIVNIGVPGGIAFKAASGLGKATIAAMQAGKAISRGEKTRRFAQGSIAAGLAEGVTVGDVQEAGTFGDFMGGPTEINRDSDSAANELINRLKFGIEGAAFTGAFGAAGKLIGKMREVRGSNKAKRGFDKSVDKLDSWFRSNGLLTQEGFDAKNVMAGRVARDTNVGDVAMRQIDKLTDKLAKNYRNVAVDKVPFLEAKKTIGKELNDVLMSGTAKNGKLKPEFFTVDEIALDATGKEFKTGKQIYNVEIKSIPSNKKEALEKLLKTKYKAKQEDITKLFNQFDGIRDTWSELFTLMGRRLTPQALKDFETMIPKYINDVLDRGYEYAKATSRNPIQLAANRKPSDTLIKNAIKEFQDIAESKGLKLNDDIAKDMVDDVWKGAYLPQGLTIGKGTAPGQIRFKAVPAFMKDSLAKTLDNDTISKRLYDTNISEVSGVSQTAIKNLLGKANNPMSSIVDGTANLSAMVRSNQFFDDLILKNNKLKTDYDEWLAGGKVGQEPRIPFLYNTTDDAIKYAGGSADDFDVITSAKGDAAREIDRWLDPAATLKTIDQDSLVRTTAKGEIMDLLNPLQGKVALKDYANAFKNTQEGAKSFPRQIYNGLILYPKGLSQMSKTILAPFTHARNFISATAFAAANGHLPFGQIDDVKKAWNSLQAPVIGGRQNNAFYQELLELGVVNSNVQLRQVADLLEDVDFGKTLNKLDSDYGLGRFLKGLRKIKRGAEDYYTAEDDFWKIFTYLGEKSKLDKAFRNSGLRDGMEFIDMNGAKQIFNDQYLKKAAADMVKNNVPNYAFVSDFIKGLRQLPVGNFVAFPAEIIRTSSNIVETALKEINYSTVINGKTVNPLRGRGIQRLTGMAATTAVLPIGTVAAAQAIYNVADDEIDAMRRYVADWSKNSVLVPFKDDDGKLSYIDFSHLNAYDTVTRPIQTVLNAVNAGRADEDGLVDDFVLGMFESTKELGSPFISESIWTAGLADIFVRGGETRDNRKLWNDKDSIGDKMSKSIGHLVDTQMPLNWKQMQRIGLSLYPVNSLGKFDERGNQYDLGNELAGIAGLRRVEVNPEKSFNYKITNYKKGIRDSRNLFTAATLKGGVVTPEQIVDAYINSNRALYETNREMFLDMEAAKTLGMSEDKLAERMVNRGESTSFGFLTEGLFRPLTISGDVQGLFETKAREIGVRNPFEAAYDVIGRIQEVLSEVPLNGDLFPNIKNPLSSALLPDVVGQANQLLNNNPANAAMATAPGFIGQQNTNIDPVTRLTSAEEVLLDPLEQRYVKNKRTNTRLT